MLWTTESARTRSGEQEASEMNGISRHSRAQHLETLLDVCWTRSLVKERRTAMQEIDEGFSEQGCLFSKRSGAKRQLKNSERLKRSWDCETARKQHQNAFVAQTGIGRGNDERVSCFGGTSRISIWLARSNESVVSWGVGS